MIQSADLPDTLSVFPLPGALLLPRSRLPLHIFEPRYLQMLEDALKTPQRLIGMVQPFPGKDGTNELHSIGCAGRVTQFSETEDGRYLIITVWKGTNDEVRLLVKDLREPFGMPVDLIDNFDAAYDFLGNEQTTDDFNIFMGKNVERCV